MLTYNNKQYRNLEEQVAYITERYKLNQGLSEWGIRVLGTFATPIDLPDPDTYEGEFGDAYAIGPEPPYNFYIWTRVPDSPVNGEWFNYGDISVVGPAGPQGIQGPTGATGDRGSRWFSGKGAPTLESKYQEYDYYVDVAEGVNNGNLWHLHRLEGGSLQWLREGSIRGTQGIQGIQGPTGPQGEKGDAGPQGPAGPAGPIIDILGYITNIDQLPDPSTVPINAAYLQKIDSTTYVWTIVGGQWTDAGIFGGGTLVTAGSVLQSEWDADTKVDKITTSGARRVYAINGSGGQTVYTLTSNIQTGSGGVLQIVCRDGASSSDAVLGQIRVPDEPIYEYHAASKGYVDNTVTNKLDKVEGSTTYDQVYTKLGNGIQSVANYTTQVVGESIVQRQANGNIIVPATPTAATDAVSKGYVDNSIVGIFTLDGTTLTITTQ